MPDVLETLKILCAEGDGNVMCEAADEIERLRTCLKWLLENDELTNYGQKTARKALKD